MLQEYVNVEYIIKRKNKQHRGYPFILYLIASAQFSAYI